MSSFEDFYRSREHNARYVGSEYYSALTPHEIAHRLLQDEVIEDMFRGPMPEFVDRKVAGREFLDSVEELLRIKYESVPGYYHRAIQNLSDICGQSGTKLATITHVVRLLVAFIDNSPDARAWNELEQTLFAECTNTKEYDLILQGIADVFICLDNTSSWGLGKMLSLTEQARRILNGDDVAPNTVPDLSKVLLAMVNTQRRFRGIQSVKSLYRELPEGFDKGIVTRAIVFGIEDNETPKALVKALRPLVQILNTRPSVLSALDSALEDQYSNNGSIVSLLESFCRLIKDSDGPELDGTMAVYDDFLQQLRNHRVRVDGIGAEQLDTLRKQQTSSCISQYATHVRIIDDYLDQLSVKIRSDGAKEDSFLREVTSRVQANVSGEMLQAFGEYVQCACDGYADLRQAWKSFSTMLTAQSLTSERWNVVCEMLSHQRWPVRRDITQLLETIACVVNRPDAESEWQRFVDTMAYYRDTISDLRLITPEFVDRHHVSLAPKRFGELERALQLAELIYVSDTNRQIVFRDLMSSLLEKDGLADVFLQAYESDDLLGIARPKACRAYWAFQELSQFGLEDVVSQVVSYQSSEGFPALESIRSVHEVCSALEFLAEDAAKRIDKLTEYRKVIQYLQRRKLPLEGLNYSIVESCLKDQNDSVAMGRVEEHLRRAHRLFIRNTGEPYTNLIRRLSRYGFGSAGLQVVELLMDDPSGNTISPGRLADRCRFPEALGRRGWLSIGRYVALYREKSLPIADLLDWALAYDRELKVSDDIPPVDWEVTEELLVDLRDAGLTPELVSLEFARSYQSASETIKPLMLLALRTLTEFNQNLRVLNDDKVISTLRDSLAELSTKNFGLMDNPAMVYKLRLILLKGEIHGLEDYRIALRELKMHALTDIMRSSPDKARRDWARNLIGKEFNIGGPPFLEEDPRKKAAFNETMEVVDRAVRESKGFGAVAIDSRGAPQTEVFEPVAPFLVRYALDCMDNVYVVNSSSNTEFPGKGVFMSNMKVKNVFTSDSNWKAKGKSSPFWLWEDEGGLFSSKYFYHCRVENLSRTGFLMMRGLKVVVPPPDRDHLIDGYHYSYLVYNRHFYPGPQTAIAVPTEVLKEQLEPALVPASDFVGFSSKNLDVQRIDLTFSGLLRNARSRKLPLLDLTYGSVVGGGLCNAYLPMSSPHYSWEIDALKAWGWKDSWGHVHKAFLMRYPDDEGRLAVFQNLHKEVYRWTRLCQDYLTAWQFAFSFYKMGTTLAREDDMRQEERSPQGQEEDGDRDMPFDEDRQSRVHAYRYRMLEEAYRWFRGGREQGWSINMMPVLHFAYTIDPNSIPRKEKRKFELDTATMVLKVGSQEIQLPQDGNGRGEYERQIWKDFVVPFFEDNSTGWEPRFLLRNGAFSLYE